MMAIFICITLTCKDPDLLTDVLVWFKDVLELERTISMRDW